MKLLPCPRCGQAKGPSGQPIVVGRLSSSPLRFLCGGCKQSVLLTALDWNRLPECPPDEAERALAAEAGQGGLPPFTRTQRIASSILSPTAGRLVS